LQQHDRRDDDDERAGVEPLRRQLADGALDARPHLPRPALLAEELAPACGPAIGIGSEHLRLRAPRLPISRCGVYTLCRARFADRPDWPDRSRSCALAV